MKKQILTNQKANSGITLIALVITIIVLLILAGVSIATLTGENGILTQASKAKETTEIAEAKERAQLDIAAWRAERLEKNESTTLTNDIIKDILTGKDYVGTAGDSSFTTAKDWYEILYSDLYNTSAGGSGEPPTSTAPSTVEEAQTEGTVFSTNTEITDLYGNKVVVPEGFKIATESATDVTGGLVIEDVDHGETAGSQFVWIPVGTVWTNDDRTGSETIKLGRYDTLGRDLDLLDSGNFVEEDASDPASLKNYGNMIAKDIEGFKTSVAENGGYYIGRYSAGDPLATSPRTNQSGASGPVVSKRGQYVYNYVTQQRASALARSMYSCEGFTSDLTSSYAWTTAIIFIQKFSGDGEYGLDYTGPSPDCRTGEAGYPDALDVKCNIYDMAGLVMEYTTETSLYPNRPFTYMGAPTGIDLFNVPMLRRS